MAFFTSFAQGTVSLRKVFWVGIVMAVFNPPIVGFIFALLFAFRRETRREALIIALWAVVWSVLYAVLIHVLLAHGIVVRGAR